MKQGFFLVWFKYWFFTLMMKIYINIFSVKTMMFEPE